MQEQVISISACKAKAHLNGLRGRLLLGGYTQPSALHQKSLARQGQRSSGSLGSSSTPSKRDRRGKEARWYITSPPARERG